ncbi:Trk system potassium uptake protein TrkA [Planctomycetes bacterium Poly30]|uniref:Trk system potassium uptake protein TrkA n=1 Tax=Saltatorellus ferox TaxID=2528018 RepID=A0A518EUZ2_9BACT|nr:Trk system potassium uptake protein TrkA [Planctomycetes bacterium Poly30]
MNPLKIVIVGAGEVGQHIAGILSREQHAVTIVDPDPAKARKLAESFDLQTYRGDGTRADVLMDAGASTADLVVAVADDDHVNLLTSVIAKRLGARRVIVRLKDTRILESYRYFYKDTLGFDIEISVEQLAADKVQEMVREHHALEVESFANGKVQMRRLPLRTESELTSAPLGEIRMPSGVLVAAISRRGELEVPSGDAELMIGDQVYLMGTKKGLDAFEKTAGEKVAYKRSVVVYGISSIGRAIAKSLSTERGLNVIAIESDEAKARAFDLECNGKLKVLVGDVMDRNVLQEEGIGDASVFVSATEDDGKNIVACQLAKAFGVERTVAVIDGAGLSEIFDFLEGVDQIVSPRIASANAIMRFVRAGSLDAIAVIAGGKAEVLEFVTVLHEPTKVKKLGLPKGVVLGAIVRGEEVTVPAGDTVVRDGDTLIVFAKSEAIPEVEKLLRDR